MKVFCDVVDAKYAKKVQGLGCDGLIAVNSRAGGHAGPLPPEEFIPLLLSECDLPVVSAGGIGDY
jgi:nitronate monooxygenase